MTEDKTDFSGLLKSKRKLLQSAAHARRHKPNQVYGVIGMNTQQDKPNSFVVQG
jgi:hypothetical protein